MQAKGASNGTGPKPPSFWAQVSRTRTLVILIAVWLVFAFLMPMLFGGTSDRLTISYTVFVQQVQQGNVSAITSQGDAIQGSFKTATPDPSPPSGQTAKSYTLFATQLPTFADNQQLMAMLQEHGVAVNASPPDSGTSPLLSLLFTFGPILLLIGGFFWIARQGANASGGVFGLGQSRARRYDGGTATTRATFADVAGVDEVKDDLIEIVDFLRSPQKYTRLGGRMPKGVLLVGPPGTGKTLLARAVAGEAQVPFFSMSGSEFIEMIVGVGAARVRDLFAQAKAAAPAIIFLDELDAIGRRRGTGNLVGGNDEREQTLAQLLAEMDGFDTRQGVIVLAATNRADVLDPALLRPGRFDRRVVVHPPDRAGRAAILRLHTSAMPLAADVDLEEIAAETPGLVGADLFNLVNEAALLAARQGHNAVRRDDLGSALEKIALGAERRIVLSLDDRRRIAYHESGHALVGLLEPESDPVRRVTVVPHGQALGVTLSVPEADRYHYSETYLRARLTGALGGRAAEQLVYGAVTTGAENDLQQVAELARAMVTRWGMSPEIGLLAVEGVSEGNYLDASVAAAAPTRSHGDALFQAVDLATRHIIDACYNRALELLTANRERLDRLADALVRHETLDEADIRRVTDLPAGTEHEAAPPALAIA